jgi:hypothetical protein
MRAVPRGVHREVLRRPPKVGGEDQPEEYALWLGPPHGTESELLGRASRLPRGRWWRAAPVTGEFPQSKRLFNNVVAWLLEVRDGHAATRDGCTGTEAERVSEQ